MKTRGPCISQGMARSTITLRQITIISEILSLRQENFSFQEIISKIPMHCEASLINIDTLFLFHKNFQSFKLLQILMKTRLASMLHSLQHGGLCRIKMCAWFRDVVNTTELTCNLILSRNFSIRLIGILHPKNRTGEVVWMHF